LTKLATLKQAVGGQINDNHAENENVKWISRNSFACQLTVSS